MAQSTPSSARSLSKQAITKTALRVAEEILKDPKKEADAHPLVIQALEAAIWYKLYESRYFLDRGSVQILISHRNYRLDIESLHS